MLIIFLGGPISFCCVCWMLWVIGVGSGKGVSSSLSSRILTGQDRHTTMSFFSSVRPSVRSFRRPILYLYASDDDDDDDYDGWPRCVVFIKFLFLSKRHFLFCLVGLLLSNRVLPPLHFFFRKMSSTTNVILHTHTENCPALWCRGSTPFSRPH